MTDTQGLVVMLGVAKESLRLLAELTADAAAEYEPPGYDLDRQRRGSTGTERPIPVRLDGDGNPAGGLLDDPLRRSVLQLRAALADLADVPELSRVIAPTFHGQHTTLAEHADLARRLSYGLQWVEGTLTHGRLDNVAHTAAGDACDAILAAVDEWPAWITRAQRRCAGRPEWWQPADGVWELRPRDCHRRLTGRGYRCDACKRWLSRLREFMQDAG